jgi:hypothetical protein
VVEPVGVHGQQGADHGQERDGVEEERWGDPDRRDQPAGHGRADHPGGVEAGAVEADGVGDPVGADHLAHERLAGRHVEGGGAAQQQGQGVDHPQPHRPGGGQGPEDQGEHGHRGLGDQQQAALVEPVGGQPGPGPEGEHGGELEGQGDPERQGGVGEAQHQPVLADLLHPGAGGGDQVAEQEQPEVAHVEGTEGAQPRSTSKPEGVTAWRPW